jgi:hypothetical protein
MDWAGQLGNFGAQHCRALWFLSYIITQMDGALLLNASSQICLCIPALHLM